MRHGSLFSGIGGFDLAAQWMGWENVFQVEIDGYCQKVLQKNFPNVRRYGDIREFNGTEYRGKVDIISGGFPCQPFSNSGSQLGDQDERYLWGQMLRAIREVKPKWIVAENVRSVTSKRFEQVFEHICTSLEHEGYEVQPLIIPATSVEAEHERYRVWIVANSKRARLQGSRTLPGQVQPTKIGNRETSRFVNYVQGNAMPYVCREHHGISRRLDECRMHSIGNAVVPQIPYEIFKAIQAVEPINTPL